MFRVSKEFRFEANHNLPNHDGKCRNEHGHSYVIEVTFEGINVIPIPTGGTRDPKEGMLVDFYDVSRLVQPFIDQFDHNGSLNFTLLKMARGIGMMGEVVSTAELTAYILYMAIESALVVDDTLRDLSIQIHSVKVHETAKTTAEYVHDKCIGSV